MECFDCDKSLFQFLREEHFLEFQINLSAMKRKQKFILMSLKSWKPPPKILIDLKPKEKKNPLKWIANIVIIATSKYVVLDFKD